MCRLRTHSFMSRVRMQQVSNVLNSQLVRPFRWVIVPAIFFLFWGGNALDLCFISEEKYTVILFLSTCMHFRCSFRACNWSKRNLEFSVWLYVSLYVSVRDWVLMKWVGHSFTRFSVQCWINFRTIPFFFFFFGSCTKLTCYNSYAVLSLCIHIVVHNLIFIVLPPATLYIRVNTGSPLCYIVP